MDKQEPKQTQENLRALLEQHWLHCRHLEYERTWFLLGFIASIAGGMVAFSDSGSAIFELLYIFILFLSVLTFFGFFFTMRWIYAFECHRIKVNKLARIIWLESGNKAALDPTMDIPPIRILPEFICGRRIPDSHRRKVDDLFRTRYWFPLFYFTVLVGCTLLLFSIECPTWAKVLAVVATVVASLLGARWHFSLKEVK